MSAAPPRRLVTLYEWTTHLMPAAHRWKYADEQTALFERVWREECPSGYFARSWWATVLLSKSVFAALEARFDQRRRATRTGGAHRGRGGRTGSDVRFAMRALKASPWYAAAVVSVIGITLALATTTFAIVDGVLFRPLPYPESDRLVSIRPGFRDTDPVAGREVYTSAVDLANWQGAVPEAELTGYSASSAAESGSGTGLNNDTSATAEVQSNFFRVIGVQPLFGGFADADFLEQAHYRPVILMYDTWQGRFDGDPNVLGKVEILIRPRDLGFRVVGVMPRGFTFPTASESIDFIAPIVPASPSSATDPRSRGLREVVGRVPRGMSPAQVVDRLVPALAQTAKLYESFGGPRRGFDPKTERAYDMVKVTGLSAALARRSGSLFLAVVVAAALLILLAAANVSSLMTSRALEGREELQVRRSFGATTGAIVRLWMTEAAVLMTAGTLVGVLVAAPFLTMIVTLLPDSVVLLKAPRIDWRVAGFVVVTMGVLCAMVSVAPIRWSLRVSSNGPAKGGSSERVRTPGRFAVVAGQVAAAFVLTAVGACLVGSLLMVYGNDLPIRTEGVIVLESRLHGPGGRRSPADTVERVVRGRLIRDRLSQIPGVTTVGLVEAEVLRGSDTNNLFSQPDGVARLPGLDTWGVTGAFYQVIEPVVTAGRLQTEEELESGEPLIVVSEAVARAYWPAGQAIGQSLTDARGKVSHTVIGVVRDVRWHRWDLESPMIYGPYSRLTNSPFQTFFIRTQASAAATIQLAVGAVVEADPTMRTRTAATLEEMFGASVALRRFQSWLFGGFAAAALVVVGVGILGLLAMSAARRTREVGIRCALGATPGSVAGLMVREQLGAIAIGLMAGGVVSAWAVRFVEGYLYELTVADPRIWGTAVASILAMAAIGTLVPAIRASRINPLKALRTE